MEIEKFEGDLFWNSDDPEAAIDDPDDELGNIGDIGAIVEFEQAKRLPNFYGVDCGEDDKGRLVARYFDTLAEAEECSKGLPNG
jgi:hypothetical protein